MATIAPTRRGRETRERLLNATADLVAARGFHSVGIAEIGAAAGVSGAAIYRHYANKQELVVALIDRVVDGLLLGAREVVEQERDPEDALEALVHAHVEFALRDRAIIAVYDQEARKLPAADARRLRSQQRAYAEIWVGVVRDVRPELSRAAAATAVHATFGLLNSVADFHSALDSDELGALLASMALAALRDTEWRESLIPTSTVNRSGTEGEVRTVGVLHSTVDAASDVYRSNREGLLALLAAHEEQVELARRGGGERYVERHRQRGKLTARERIERLLDQDAPFLELSPLAAWGTPFNVGGSIVTGIGVVSGVECVIIAQDPTVRGGTMNPNTLKKNLRALEIARVNRLPVVNLVESGGADLTTQADLFIPGGQIFRDLTQLSALRIPTIALVFGNSTAGGAYVPGMCDYAVLVDQRAKVFLGGPPLVKMATGEESGDEELGGASMHSRISGLSDYLAVDELDCLRIGRQIVADLNWRKLGPGPSRPADEPVDDPEDLLGIASVDLRIPFDPRDVLARVVDGSRFDEYKPTYGTSLVTGWASIHGYPIGVLANARGVLFMDEAKKATEFILLANQNDTPLLFLQNTTGYMVGKEYEQAGIIKDGAKMINAVANSTVPHLTVIVGASYGAGNYGMCGRAYGPRLLFAWPNAKVAVMGPAQLAGVLSIVARDAAAAAGRPFDEDADAIQRQAVEEQIERESHAFLNSGKGYDDGIIDPRDTRTVLGLALSMVDSNVVEGRRGFGVFRM